jgi:type II secretory pathway pseudopilin PulG
MRGEFGFSIVEVLAAAAILLVAIASLVIVSIPSHAAFSSQSETVDLQQRLRVVVDTLSKDLLAAGSGGYVGAGGSALTYSSAPVLPYRVGARGADPPGTFRPDTITILSVARSGGGTVSTTYLLKTPPGGPPQLVVYDGTANPDVPVVDNVVGLSFDYYGDPQPPTMRKMLADDAGPWTTYGPPPPSVAAPPFGPGENCVFTNDGSPTPRPRLAALGAVDAPLLKLTAAQLTDGPWCPDDGDPARWDADLLRVRRIVVTVRVQAASAALRGPAGPLFSRAGTAQEGSKWVPDQEIRFDVSPRNLNLGR